MASENIPLSYKGHPLRRKDNLIYYGTMAEKYIIMLQILSTPICGDGTVWSRKVKKTASMRPWISPPCGWTAL